MRHRLERRSLRLKRLEKWAAEKGNILTENQVQALEQAKEEKEGHGEIETYHPDSCLDKTPSMSAGSRASARYTSRPALIHIPIKGLPSSIRRRPLLHQQISSMTGCYLSSTLIICH